MTDHVLFDQLRVSFCVPKDLDDAACEAIRRLLQSQAFRSSLRRAVRQLVPQYPDLHPVPVRISS